MINNVAALVLLMPLDINAAQRAGRTARKTLISLSFTSILGGMVGLILLMLVEPGSQNDWVSGNAAAAVGAWGAMALFDRISGGATS